MSNEDALKAMSDLYHKGFVGDHKIFEEILAEDFREIDAEGNILDRKGFINKVKTVHSQRYSKNAHINILEMEVRVFGDFGMVHALVELIDRGSSVGVIRYTDTYVRTDSKWKAINAHISPGRKTDQN